MRTLHLHWSGIIRLLPAALLAIWPAFLFYLLVLQLPFISYQRIGLGLLSIPVFAYPAYIAYPRASSAHRGPLAILALGSLVLTLMLSQVLAFYANKAYLFYGRHTIELTSSGGAFELRGLKTSLGAISYSSLQGSEAWERQGNRLIPRSATTGALIWRGWTADSVAIEVSASPGSILSVRWDGLPEEYPVDQESSQPLFIIKKFQMPVFGSLLLLAVLFFSIYYLASILFLLPRESASPLLTKVSPSLRVALLVVVFAGLGLLLLKLYLPLHPGLHFPDRDSGFFMYAGRQVTQGGVPYRDFWDHKGPLVYYINALGLIVGEDSAAGVWAIETAWSFISLILLFLLLREVLGDLPAVLGSAVFVQALGSALQGGNFTEEYCILFYILELGLFWLFLRSDRDRWLLLGGLAGAGSFLLRPNQISITAAIGLYLLVVAASHRWARASMRSIASFALGLGIPVLSMVLYLGSQGALSDMVGAVFVFNRSYVSGSGTDLLRGFHTGLYAFPFAGFWIIGGLTAALAHLHEPALQSPRWRFLVAVLIALLAEFVFSNLSGLGYKHYYLTWVPFTGFLTAYFAYSLLRLLGTCLPAWKPGPNSLYGTLLLVLAPIFMGMAAHLASQYFPLDWMTSAPVWDTPAHPMNRLRPYLLREHGLLMWGNEVAHNFMLDVEAPTRFAYQVPLLQPAFTSEPMLRDFISDLSADLPVIVDTSGAGSFIIPLEPVRRAAFFSRPENAARYQYLEPLFEFIDTNYQPPVPASGTWVIFLPRQASPLH